MIEMTSSNCQLTPVLHPTSSFNGDMKRKCKHCQAYGKQKACLFSSKRGVNITGNENGKIRPKPITLESAEMKGHGI